MASSTFNPTKHIKRQGVDPNMVYAATVVDNNDPRQRGRIRARIDGFMDGIDDDKLPWILAVFNHADGSMEGDKRSGTFDVPQKGARVGVRFPFGDPHRPEIAPYPIDDKRTLPEAEPNYPKRKVIRLGNGWYIIVDTETNEMFFNNPGDMHMTILGDCTQTIVGKQTLIVTGDKGEIPGYVTNAPKSDLGSIPAKSAGGVEFQGSGGNGSQYTKIKGDQTVIIEGNRNVTIKGNDSLKVLKNRTEQVTGRHVVRSQRSETN